MSTSTSVSGVIYRRTVNSARKQRPASIASTGMTASCIADISVESKFSLFFLFLFFYFQNKILSLTGDASKQKKDRPPLPKTLSTPRRSTAATPSSATSSPSTSTPVRSTDTPKRTEKRLPPSNKKVCVLDLCSSDNKFDFQN